MAMAGKVAVVTGANTGVGKACATELAAAGAHVIMACRSRARATPARDAIIAATGNSGVEVLDLDLAKFSSVRDFAREFTHGRLKDKPLHVLVNNAGIMTGQKEMTEDGYETTWQVNFLAPFLLASLLLPNIKKAAAANNNAPGSARIGSRLEKTADLKVPADIDRHATAIQGFSTFPAYGASKLAATAATYELARRLQDTKGVSVNVVTPGMVNTELSRYLPSYLQILTWPLRWGLLRTPAKGGETPAWLAMSDEPAATVTGRYFYDKKEIQSSAPTYDAELARELWARIEAALALQAK
eukprot:jgi/Chlat1/1506/Chrsp12S00109